MIETTCPKCGDKRMFTDDKAGKSFKCPKCDDPVGIISTINVNDVSIQFEEQIDHERIELLRTQRQELYDQQYNKLIKKSKSRNVVSIICFCIALCASIMVIQGDSPQFINILFWGGLGLWLQSRSKKYKLQANELIHPY